MQGSGPVTESGHRSQGGSRCGQRAPGRPPGGEDRARWAERARRQNCLDVQVREKEDREAKAEGGRGPREAA